MTSLILLLACTVAPDSGTVDTGSPGDSGHAEDSGDATGSGCGACDHVLSGTFTAHTAEGAGWEALVEAPVDFAFTFEVVETEPDVDCEWVGRYVWGGPSQVVLSGGPDEVVQEQLAAAWAWQALTLYLGRSWGETSYLQQVRLAGPLGDDEVALYTSQVEIELPVAEDGGPLLGPFEVETQFHLTRAATDLSAPTASATGTILLSHASVE